jgi:hypothetical protein
MGTRPAQYRLIWVTLLQRAIRRGIAPANLGRVNRYLRSHHDKTIFQDLEPWQNPRFSYFPGLRAQTSYDAREFSWTGPLEDASRQIKAELLALQGSSTFSSHPQNLVGAGSWKVRYCYLEGQPVAEVQQLCPTTSQVLKQSFPLGPNGHIFFSVLGRQSTYLPTLWAR